ncbi:ATPase, V0 complex, subunit E1/e2 [Protomyces lactucae-debilis]|uniref:ATPase, V0 complex, subunit E1/e2 n=1 Tax=Protomyces lactucae-debilis TaxID=2754530 RepID=A0A1Y2FIG1_PROLT|nr:ATPase, V0 complex, subunit E1/e2 [Protomyces lactucae-debilis]ORY82605.1 ATPase, V0 complex, subunit E1/e2 [Protomyces lactucae-debilis]
MSGLTVLLVAAVIAALCAVCYVFSPKGDNQTVWRMTSILTLVSMYLMWMLTYMAQLHPLVAPRKANEHYQKSS